MDPRAEPSTQHFVSAPLRHGAHLSSGPVESDSGSSKRARWRSRALSVDGSRDRTSGNSRLRSGTRCVDQQPDRNQQGAAAERRPWGSSRRSTRASTCPTHPTRPKRNQLSTAAAHILAGASGDMVRRRALIPDSGGTGRDRGGLGQETILQSRTSHSIRTALSGGRFHHAAPGMEGGDGGARGEGAATARAPGPGRPGPATCPSRRDRSPSRSSREPRTSAAAPCPGRPRTSGTSAASTTTPGTPSPSGGP